MKKFVTLALFINDNYFISFLNKNNIVIIALFSNMGFDIIAIDKEKAICKKKKRMKNNETKNIFNFNNLIV